jgi:chromate transporter
MAMMRDELVVRRNLVSSDRYIEGLGVVKLLPGPVSSLLAVYLGLDVAGVRGGLVSIAGFVLPSFLMLLGICIFEEQLGPRVFQSSTFLTIMHGLQIAVLAVILQTCWKLFRDAQRRVYAGRPRTLVVVVCTLISAILASFKLSEIYILLFCVTISFLWLRFFKRRENEAPPNLKSAVGVGVLTLFFSFFNAGLTVFGTGYMVLPYLQRVLVHENGWLQPSHFLEAVAYGNLTPGPVVIASTYMGYKMTGLSGAFAATLGIFAGPTLLMLVLGPFLKKIMAQSWVEGVLLGLLPAVAGSIAIGTLILSKELIWTPVSYAIFVVTGLMAIFQMKSLWVLAAGALLAFILGHLSY